ncbi:MAG: 3-isopropylmalate dehydratase small subunit [Bacillota bacterium]|nr:3-isopropylmalate dehydratase small subunit [Bacillota bacterium]
MSLIVEGKAVILDVDDINTDQLYPASNINLSEPAEIAKHIFSGLDSNIQSRLVDNILVVGENFGCGSSREHAVIGLKASGLKAVIASSVGRIWYRNAINLALPVIICPNIVKKLTAEEEIEVNLETSIIKSFSTGTSYQGEPISDFVLNIIKNGGIKPLLKKQYSSSQD